MKKILVPTDFSKPAQIAVDVAADIAQKSNSELILLHVAEEAVGNSFNVEGQVSSDAEGWEDKIFTMRLIEKAKKQMAIGFPLINKLKLKDGMTYGIGIPIPLIEKSIDQAFKDKN